MDEILDDHENITSTHHPQLKIAVVRHCNYHHIEPQINSLMEAVYSGAPDHVLVKQMKEIIPEFSSQNSIFSVLDAV
jgi:hypothetical protein